MSHKLLGIDPFKAAQTTPEHELGVIVRDVKGGQGSISFKEVIDGATITRTFSPDAEYKYVRATGTIAANDWVILDTAQTDEPAAVVATSAVNQSIEGCACVAMTSGQYGWIQVRGRVPAANATANAGEQLGTSATGGRLTAVTISASPTQAEVQRVLAAAVGRGVIALDTHSSNVAECYIF